MSVTVHEGLPGCGKTLRVLTIVRDVIQKDKRSVYLFNFKLTDKGIDYFKKLASDNQVTFEIRPERFSELNVELSPDEKTGYTNLRTLNINDGAVIIFDEAQMFFPVRASTKPAPAIVKLLPTHRHSGYDLHFITQNKAFLDIDIRRIADTYVKYSRMMNGQFCRLEFYSKCPDSAAELAQSHLKSEHFKYPKEIFELYVSAVEHNMKFRIPAKLKVLVVAVVVLIGATYLVIYTLGSFSKSFVGGFKGDSPSAGSTDLSQSAAHPHDQPNSNGSNKPSSAKSQSQSDAQSRPFMAPPIPTTPPPVNSLGAGKPHTVDLSLYAIYYNGYSRIGSGDPKPLLYLFDERMGSCTVVGKDFFMAMGYEMLVTRTLVVIKPMFSKKSKPFVVPMMPSPCVNQYALQQSKENEYYQSNNMDVASNTGLSNSQPHANNDINHKSSALPYPNGYR